MSPADPAVQEQPRASAIPARRQRFQHPGRDRQWLGQPDGQSRPPAIDSAHGRAGVRQEHVPVEHRGTADLVHDPRQQARVRRAQEGNRFPGRDECRDREGRRADARGGRGGRLRRTAQAQHASQRSGLLSGALRQARRAGLSGREAATPCPQHDLRRHPGEAARDRPGVDGAGARQAAREKGEGRDAQSGRAQGRAGTTPRRTSRSRIRSASSR